MPVFVPALIYTGVLAVTTAGGATVLYLAKRDDGVVETVAKEVYDELEEQGVPILESLINEIGSGLASIGSKLGNATLEVLEFAGPKIVDGIDNTYDYIREKIRGSEPAIIEAMTFGFLAVLTVVYIWNTAKKGE